MSKLNKELEKHCEKIANNYAEKVCEQIMGTVEHIQSDLDEGSIIATLYLANVAGYVMGSILSNTEGTIRDSFLMTIFK